MKFSLNEIIVVLELRMADVTRRRRSEESVRAAEREGASEYKRERNEGQKAAAYQSIQKM
jgi:hypothetical protein